MKYFWLFLILISYKAVSQDDCLNSKVPLDGPAFRKMINHQFSYAILGQDAPVSGFKFETAKPTITLTGNLVKSKTHDFILNLSLTGGVTDDIGTLFSAKKLNGYFKLSTGLNFALPFRKGIYNWEKITEASHGMMQFKDGQDNQKKYETAQDIKMNAAFRTIICENRESISKQIDTAAVVISLLEVNSFSTLGVFVEAVNAKFNTLHLDNFTRPELSNERVLGILNNYLVKSDPALTEAGFTNFVSNLTDRKTDMLKLDQLLTDYIFWKKLQKTDFQNQQYDYAIEKLKNIWIKTRAQWINVTPSIANTALTLFDETSKHLTDSNSALYGIDISWNWYTKYKGPRYTYIRAGIGFTRTNNLDELGTVDYRTSARQASNTDSLFEEKSGTAYKGMIKHGSEFNVYGELYLAPWKFPIGFYSTVKYRKSDTWINTEKLALNLGLIWNVVNSDADAKNVLSIIPYVGWSNILTDYTDATKTKHNKASDLFSVNIKFGIPINLGK